MMSQSPDIQATLTDIYNAVSKDTPSGTPYSEELLHKGDRDRFALAIATRDGQVFTAGDSDKMFALQSMSKAFTYGLALEDHGRDGVLKRIGVEPTGRRYNAILLDETGRPYNPMVNAGAIAVADLVKGNNLTERLNRIVHMLSAYVGRHLQLDAEVFTYELQIDNRNRAIAHLMRSSGMLHGSIDEALHLYYQHCSLLITTRELALMAATLANGGSHPITGEQALKRSYVRDVLSVMYTCGMYDSSGEWAYKVGLPAKSGVSGGIFAVVPGVMGIAAFSPLLNGNGHSVRGVRAFELLSEQLNLHTFDLDTPTSPGGDAPTAAERPAPM
ncbi:MAG: glutaminase A [Chloroflexota bacterium]